MRWLLGCQVAVCPGICYVRGSFGNRACEVLVRGLGLKGFAVFFWVLGGVRGLRGFRSLGFLGRRVLGCLWFFWVFLVGERLFGFGYTPPIQSHWLDAEVPGIELEFGFRDRSSCTGQGL